MLNTYQRPSSNSATCEHVGIPDCSGSRSSGYQICNCISNTSLDDTLKPSSTGLYPEYGCARSSQLHWSLS